MRCDAETVLEGLVLIALGVGLLVTAPAFVRDAGPANRTLRGKRFGDAQTKASAAVGVVIGVIAIATGIVWATSAVV